MKKRFLGLILVAVLAAESASAQSDSGTSLRDSLSQLLRGGGSSDQPATQEVQRKVPFSNEQVQLSYAPLVSEIAPAVVNVYASTRVEARSPFMGDPFFERFFSLPQMPPRVQSSLGSGVFVDASGIVVTNYHVIGGADEVRVALSDGREYAARVVLQDEALDLAILKVDADEEFPIAPLGDSEALQVGDLVLAIGNPFGVGQTTTSGIVSAVSRTLGGIGDFGYFIQTDAAINPGNSGGALINMRGEVIGINTAIYSRTGGSIGIGFAIPANLVRAVVDAAKNGSDYFERPYIGANLDRVTPDIANALGMGRPAGALVTNIAPDSPAERAGLAPADVVVAVDGKPVETPETLDYRLATLPLDSTVEVEVLRGGETKHLSLTIEKAPEGQGAQLQISGRGPFSGATVSDLTPAVLQRLRLPVNQSGVVVLEIARNSPAARVGVRPGDIVRELNGETVTTAEQLKRLAESDGRLWRFAIDRGGRIIQQTLRF